MNISYRLQGVNWTTRIANYLESEYYWYHYIDTSTLELGTYDIWVEVADRIRGWTSETEINEFNVVAANANPVIEWIHAWGTPEGRLDPGGEVQQGHMVRLSTRVSDDLTPTQNLDVEISYRPQGKSWNTHTAVYLEAKDYFYIDLDTQDADIGTYDVRVIVLDQVGGGSPIEMDISVRAQIGEFHIITSP